MVRNVISPDEGAELARLYEEHGEASTHAAAALRKYGVDSPEFLEADNTTGAIWTRIRVILGDDSPWTV